MMTTEYIACNGVKCRKVFYKGEYYYCFADTIKATINTKNVKEYIKSLLHNDLLKRHFHSHEVFLDVETTSGVQKMRCFNGEGLTNVFDYFSRRKKYESGLRKYKKVVMH